MVNISYDQEVNIAFLIENKTILLKNEKWKRFSKKCLWVKFTVILWKYKDIIINGIVRKLVIKEITFRMGKWLCNKANM